MRTINSAKPSKEIIALLEEANKEEQAALENEVPREMKLFLAHFQKTHRRHNLVYNQARKAITCHRFPFSWTDFEYTGMIKISLLPMTGVDYKEFRKDCINEFNERFGSHRVYWNYPYDTIRIYGNEAIHGLDGNNLNVHINYFSFLVKELTQFFELKEEVLMKTPLYGCNQYSIY